MKIGDLSVICWHSVKIDEPRLWFVASMPPHHYDALVDRRILAQVDVLRLVRGQHRVDMITLSECFSLL